MALFGLILLTIATTSRAAFEYRCPRPKGLRSSTIPESDLFEDLQCSPKLFDDFELRSFGNVVFFWDFEPRASGLRNYGEALEYIVMNFAMRSAFSSPGEDVGCAGAALGGTGPSFQ